MWRWLVCGGHVVCDGGLVREGVVCGGGGGEYLSRASSTMLSEMGHVPSSGCCIRRSRASRNACRLAFFRLAVVWATPPVSPLSNDAAFAPSSFGLNWMPFVCSDREKEDTAAMILPLCFAGFGPGRRGESPCLYVRTMCALVPTSFAAFAADIPPRWRAAPRM